MAQLQLRPAAGDTARRGAGMAHGSEPQQITTCDRLPIAGASAVFGDLPTGSTQCGESKHGHRPQA
jgi:hypothetical protein